MPFETTCLAGGGYKAASESADALLIAGLPDCARPAKRTTTLRRVTAGILCGLDWKRANRAETGSGRRRHSRVIGRVPAEIFLCHDTPSLQKYEYPSDTPC